ncbi:MAG: GtrA family protein [Coriobacteriales bacterium]|nr:GtrA family protein [Coriobacteriales bacterium]
MAQNSGKKESWRVVKFVLFSISAGVIEIASFTLLNELLELPYWPCYLTALILSVLWNFTLNRSFTFKAANNVPIAMLKVAAFYCVFTPVTTIGGDYLAETVGLNEYVVLGLTMALNITTEFLYDRFFVFRDSLDTNKLAKKQQEKAKAQMAKAETADASTATADASTATADASAETANSNETQNAVANKSDGKINTDSNSISEKEQ